MMATLRDFLGVSRFVGDRSGQDLVEYALLVALVGTISAAAAPTIESALSAAYSSWNSGNQILWQPPPPSGS